MAKRKWAEEQFRQVVANVVSVASALKDLGLTPNGSNYKNFLRYTKELNVDTTHFLGQGHNKGRQLGYKPKIAIEDILVENSQYSNTNNLRIRLVREGFLEYKCSKCGIVDWNGEPVSLCLDHINGVNNDNRIDNLRILCPNCHSQTETFCGRNTRLKNIKNGVKLNKKGLHIKDTKCSSCDNLINKKHKFCSMCYGNNRKHNKTMTECPICKELFYDSKHKQIYCSNKCRAITQRKQERPSKEQLELDIESMAFTSIGEKYGVSDNAIRKWARAMGLDTKGKFSKNGNRVATVGPAPTLSQA